jgi:hypothetical protein
MPPLSGLLLVHMLLSPEAIVSACINTLNAELNPVCHLLTLLGAHHIFHVGRIRVKEWLL